MNKNTYLQVENNFFEKIIKNKLYKKNLNLLVKTDLHNILGNFSKKINYNINKIKFLSFVSNFFVIRELKKYK